MQTKRNIFGSKHLAPGKNIYDAVVEGDSAIGIPPYHYDAVLDIFKAALRPEELDLLCRGFGFFKRRQTEKEIAIDLGLTDNQVSAKARAYVNKLKRSPYKTALRNLTPTAEDLFNKIASLEAAIANQSVNQASVKALKYQLANTQAQLTASEKARLTLERENATLKRDKNCAEGMLSEAQRVNGVLQDELVETMEENFAIKSINEQYEAVFTRTLDSMQKIFHGTLAKVKPKASSIVAFGFSETATKELSRVNLTTISALRRQSKHSLSKLRVSQATIHEIVEKLAKRGLSLRA